MLPETNSLDCRNATFEEWVKAVFAHPLTPNSWYWDADFVDPSLERSLELVTQLFSNPEVLEDYLEEQVREGLYFLISTSGSNHLLGLYDDKVSLEKRMKCLDSMYTLFSTYMSKHCTEHLSHIDEAGAGFINGVCYMWWDLLPIIGRPGDRNFQQFDEKVLDTTEQILALPSVACQESALHGLGHWHIHYPGACEKIIDKYLKRNTELRPDLHRYAISARQGCVN